MKIALSVERCKDCPSRAYESGGIYLCSKTGGDVTNGFLIPAWCPLPNYPMPPPQAEQVPLDQPQLQAMWNDAMYANRQSTTDAAMAYGMAIQAHLSTGAKP